MIPSRNVTRCVGTDDFSESIAMSALKELWDHMNVSTLPPCSPDYKALINVVKPFVRLWYLKEDEEASDDTKKVCPEAVGALLKYWVPIAWGEDLHVHPVDNSVMKWKVSDKSKKYENRERILPEAQASLAHGEFREYWPASSLRGELRIIEGTENWWFTDKGTHGTVAKCRTAKWYVWPKGSSLWKYWTITGTTTASGAGAAGGTIPYLNLGDTTEREAALAKLLKVNASRFADSDVTDEAAKELFGSQVLWDDAGNADIVAMLH